MKKIIAILVLVLASAAGFSQALPSGSVLFGQNTWLAPDGSVWTGKEGFGYKKVSGFTLQEITDNGGATDNAIIVTGNQGAFSQDGLQFYSSLADTAGAFAILRGNATRAVGFGTDGAFFVGFGKESPGTVSPRFEVYGDGGVSGEFSGRVRGEAAIEGNEFVTLDQLNSGGGGDLFGKYLYKDTSLVQFVHGGVVFDDNVQMQFTPTANSDAVNKGYVDDAIAGVSADVDLGASSTATTTTITNTAGSGAVISAATTSAAGVMSGADKAKLNGIESGATANQSDAYLLSRSNHTGTQAISTISGLQTALDGKEPAFSKNTAFNKNFGTAAGTVSEGNHTHPASDIASGTLAVARIPDLPAAQITSGTFSTSRIPTLSISKVSGLQSALDAKANLSGATFTGNVTAPEFFRTSTIKVKKDIKPFEESALGILSGVDVVSYYLKKGPQYKRIGFIAEDTHEYLSTPSHNVMDYGSSIGVLIKAVQELEARVKELEGRLAECQE